MPNEGDEMQNSPEFVVLDASEFPPDEKGAAKDYWSTVDTTLYRGIRPWSAQIAEKIVGHRPASVLEFGCNSGGNLEAIRALDPAIQLAGLDVNGAGTSYARTQGLACGLGDETTLLAFPPKSFDLAFTLSVIDHVPEPRSVVSALLRVARKTLILHEPWLGQEGRVVRNRHRKTGELIDTTPYSYSWDYEHILPEIAPGWSLTVEPAPIPTNIGRYYYFYTLQRPE